MRRWLLALLMGASSLLLVSGPSSATLVPHADGLGPCTSSDPPFPFHGSCGTFFNRNTFYGSYGPGFPSPMGWGFCAFEAAHGGWYPAPGYNYALGTPPTGVDSSDFPALGWAISEAQRRGWWSGGTGTTFDADDAAVAGKLLYDHVAWGAALPTLGGSLKAALTALQQLFVTGGSIAATPSLSITLDGGGTTIYTGGTVTVQVLVPGSNTPLPNQPVTLTFTGAISDTTQTATETVTTDSTGSASVVFSVPSQLPGSVGVSAATTVAVPGMLFYDPTMFPDDAQILAAAKRPVAQTKTLSITALGPPTGTLQIHKTVDDTAYYPATGAVFQVLDSSGTVVDTLTVDNTGFSNVSADLLFGDYTLHELTPPPHYAAMNDKAVTVVAGEDAVIEVGPSDGDVIDRATLTIHKLDSSTSLPLPGATFVLRFDANADGATDTEAASCVTDESGTCVFADLLPGNYFVEETSAPANFHVTSTTGWLTLEPGIDQEISYSDDPIVVTLTARKFNAAHTTVAIPRTIYDLYVVGPVSFTTPSTQPLDAPHYPGLTFVQRGVTDANGIMNFTVRAGYQWCLHEVWAPKDYIVDPSLHCTTTSEAVLNPHAALPEHASPVRLEVFKFARHDTTQGVPNAYYALFAPGAFPTGFTPAPVPSDLHVPAGMQLWAIAKTSVEGKLGFTVPGGYRWCIQELSAPANYELDPVLHCTSEPLRRNSSYSVTHMAVAEVLAGTGGSWHLGALALALLASGALVQLAARRRA